MTRFYVLSLSDRAQFLKRSLHIVSLGMESKCAKTKKEVNGTVWRSTDCEILWSDA